MCSYFLHVNCSKMPQQIKHQFDQNHVLSLLPTPIYPNGIFNCDACGNQGNGFSYHCNACSIDLHLLCASMPLSVTHQSHLHRLNLIFSSPYHNKAFSCDICKNTGTNHWLYHCSLCQFDAHLTCATATAKATNPNPNPTHLGPVQVQPNQMQQYQTKLTAPAVQAAPIQSIQKQQYQPASTVAVQQRPVQAPIQPVHVQQYQPTSTAPIPRPIQAPVQPVHVQQYQPTSTAPVQRPIQPPVQPVQVPQYQLTSIAPVQRPIQAPVQPVAVPIQRPIQPILVQQYQPTSNFPLQQIQMQQQLQPPPAFGPQYAMRPPLMQSYPPMNMGNPGMYGSVAPSVNAPVANVQNNGLMNSAAQGIASGLASGAAQAMLEDVEIFNKIIAPIEVMHSLSSSTRSS
ncbi:hypothetical protein TEA_029318 [Camellia sinensis var. sinensis]|uniref:DC1 domain-containing protein n=1 Tax=Camellia sinensis var. sinensis TaxID=542762 RepID=A0A4S4ESY0_CAMSN|nr:hypothetical protein TEA_029318 [Camellia sinensis var. sinensis]